MPGIELLWAALLVTLGFTAWVVRTWRQARPTPLEEAEPFAAFRTEFVDCDGWRLRYHRSGKGPTLLLLHGIGANLYCWRTLVPLLRGQFTVIAPDLPGFGQSTIVPGASYGLDDQTPRLASFLDALGVRETYVVGNSMGGNLALWFARTYPQRTHGVAVIGPAASPSLVPPGVHHLAWAAGPVALVVNRHAMRWIHSRTVSRRELVDLDRVEETFRTYGRKSEAIRSFLLATQAIRDERLPRAFADVRSRVLILWGSRDKLVSRRVIEGLEHVLPEAESYVHLGGGHHLQEDEPDWVAEKISTFFDVGHD